ncbi:MAG: MFS transporter [Phycisphaerae bacterium]|nr:MFS transporter [Phycisphaerae bacterium]NUQ45606.1 MFS transporter [Phycisphaerae bacterium]
MSSPPASIADSAPPRDDAPTDPADEPPRRSTVLRRDLRLIAADGGAYSLMVGIGETYFPAFVLALGAGEIAAGLVASLPMLAGGFVQLAAPWGVRRIGSHRLWVALTVAIQAASFLPMIAMALLGRGPVAIVFLAASVYWAAGLAAGAAWNTWMSRLVPTLLRTTFFAHRTRIMQAATLIGLLAGGWALQAASRPWGPAAMFAVLFSVAMLARLVSSMLLTRHSESDAELDTHQDVSLGELWRRARHGPDGRLLVYMLAVQTTIQIAGPFFTPYLLNQLHFSYLAYSVLIAAAFVAKSATLPALGRFARRRGVRRLLWLGGWGIVPLSALWLVSGDFWYLLAVQLLAGAMWGAYELGNFLMLFETIREEERTSVLAAFNLANAVALVGGSLIGGAMLHFIGEGRTAYMVLFAASFVGRLLTLPLLRRVPDRPFVPVPIVVRADAMRPSAGSLSRPVLSSLPRGAAAEESEPKTRYPIS